MRRRHVLKPHADPMFYVKGWRTCEVCGLDFAPTTYPSTFPCLTVDEHDALPVVILSANGEPPATLAACRHCGGHIPPPSKNIGKTKEFCCNPCRAMYTLDRRRGEVEDLRDDLRALDEFARYVGALAMGLNGRIASLVGEKETPKPEPPSIETSDESA